MQGAVRAAEQAQLARVETEGYPDTGETEKATREPRKPSKEEISKEGFEKIDTFKPAMCEGCGRPMPQPPSRVTFTPDIGFAICERISQGELLIDICADTEFPSIAEVMRCFIEDRFGFGSIYMRARDLGVDVLAEKLIKDAKDGSRDYEFTVTVGGGIVPVTMHEHIQRSRLVVDTIKWYISKLAPKKYGDRLNLELSGSVDIGGLSDSALNLSIEQELMMAGVPENLMTQLRPFITVVPLPDRDTILQIGTDKK